MRDGVYGGSSVCVAVLEAHVEASFVGDFGRCTIRLTKRQIIIDGAMEIGNQFGGIGALVRDERTNALDISE